MNMKKLFLFSLMFLFVLSAKSQTCDLYTANIGGFPPSHSSGFTRTQGTTYTCGGVIGLYAWYTASSGNVYIASDDVDVPQGKGISINVKSTKKSGATPTVNVYIRVTGYYTFNNGLSPTDNGWVKVNTSSLTVDCVNGSNVTVPGSIVGGQRVSVCLQITGAYSSSWWALTGFCISTGTSSSPPTTYEETFPYGSNWYPASTNIKIPYHSDITGSSAFVYLWGGGVGGTFDNYAALYTGFDITNAGTSSTDIITAEINTNNYTNGELRYAFKALYPCAGPAGYLSDENYQDYAPVAYIQQGQYYPNNWIKLPVNTYFPDGKWHYASYDISGYKNQNVKFKFERGTFDYCTNPAPGVDNIKVYDRNCSLSSQASGDITGPDSPQPGTNVQYSVTPVTGAKYYRWFVRNGGMLYTKAPYIVSGQGTTNVTVNFGSLAQPLRVICIPYDADLANISTDTTGACYAKLAYKSVTAPSCTNLSVTGQPAGQTTKCTGQSTTFNITVSGSGPAYQWKKGGNDIAGQTNSAFTLNNVAIGDAGTYSCFVSNSCSNATCNDAVLSVNITPVISSNPSGQGICSGLPVSLTVSASGTDPISYQWKKNGNVIDGATASNYQLATINTSDAGSYFCAVSNICGNISSSNVVLTVDASITINTQPVIQTKCQGQSAVFSVAAVGGDLSYHWRKGISYINDGGNISGSAANKLTLANLSKSDTAGYSCNISNACGDIFSANAKLIVNDTSLVIAKQPVTVSQCQGTKATLTVTMSENNIFKYQWLKSNKNILIATKNVYSVDSLTKIDEDFYYCKISNGCKNINSDTVFILVNQPPIVNSSPITVQKQTGESVKFLISPTGTPPFSYLWKKDNVVILNATKNTYSIPAVQESDAGFYSCYISNICGNKAAGIATLVVKRIIPNSYILDGSIIYDNSKSSPLSNIKLYLKIHESGFTTDSITTDTAGYYKFYNVIDGNYDLAVTTTKTEGGMDPTDALIANRLFLGSYTTTDTLKLRAADVNGDKKINPTDALIILRRYLNMISTFNVGKWLFDNKIIIISGINVTYDFRGICTGDINGSFTPGSNKK